MNSHIRFPEVHVMSEESRGRRNYVEGQLRVIYGEKVHQWQ